MILINIASLWYVHNERAKNMAKPSSTSHVYVASYRRSSQVLGAYVEPADARAMLIKNFLHRFKSPMEDHAQVIVNRADEYGIDFRLTTAIAMCESQLGKYMPKLDEYNPYGIAVYTGQLQGKAFDDWDHAITWVSRHIKEKYVDFGITSPWDMEPTWAPPSARGDHIWARCVDMYMLEIL